MKTLCEQAALYIVLRRDLGCKFDSQARCLRNLVAFMEERDVAFLSNRLMLEWAATPAQLKPSTRSFKLQTAHGFARHCHADDPRHEVRPHGLLPMSSRRVQPYLCSDQEVHALMQAARTDPERSAHTRETYYCLIGLLSVSGCGSTKH